MIKLVKSLFDLLFERKLKLRYPGKKKRVQRRVFTRREMRIFAS